MFIHPDAGQSNENAAATGYQCRLPCRRGKPLAQSLPASASPASRRSPPECSDPSLTADAQKEAARAVRAARRSDTSGVVLRHQTFPQSRLFSRPKPFHTPSRNPFTTPSRGIPHAVDLTCAWSTLYRISGALINRQPRRATLVARNDHSPGPRVTSLRPPLPLR